MRVLLAGITGEMQYARSSKHFYRIKLRPGDEREEFGSGRGDVSRTKAGLYFDAHPEFDAILTWDMDMTGPLDVIERLEARGLDLVAGHYYARDASALHSIWSALGDGRWPWPPLVTVPRSGLHRIGNAGMGCAFITRKVFDAVKAALPLRDAVFGIGPCPQVTGDYSSMGTDFRFFSLAQHLGFELWGDADVRCEHATTIWLNDEIYDALVPDNLEQIGKRNSHITGLILKEKGMNAETLKNRVEQLEERAKSLRKKADQARAAGEKYKADCDRSADFYERQALAVEGAAMEARFYADQTAKPQEKVVVFPAASDPEAVMKHRLGLAGFTETETNQARAGNIQREGMSWVDDLARRDNGSSA